MTSANRQEDYAMNETSERPSGIALAGGRRGFLRQVARHGASLPVACMLLSSEVLTGAEAATVTSGRPRKGAMRWPPPNEAQPAPVTLVRDFADPYLELIRLLREAAEIEHALLVQYLFAAYSLKPQYQAVAGHGEPNATDLIGVAIQEMQHLRSVNRLLVELGAAPHFERQDFPFEPDIYPFAFHMEALGRPSLAKYVYAEAPGDDVLDPGKARDPEAIRFTRDLKAMLGAQVGTNHLGSLYWTLIQILVEVRDQDPARALATSDEWIKELERIKGEGEVDHYQFFKSVFMGTHPGFKGRAGVWELDPAHEDFPAYRLAADPTAFRGHASQIDAPRALALAWLGNLHYWTTLCLLDYAYRQGNLDAAMLSQICMTGPLHALAGHLPKLGWGMPFDPLSMGYGPGRTPDDSLRFTTHLMTEAGRLAASIEADLPSDYPLDMNAYLKETVDDFLRS
jgi:Ferritin-like